MWLVVDPTTQTVLSSAVTRKEARAVKNTYTFLYGKRTRLEQI